MQLDLSDPKQAHIDERLRNNKIGWIISVRPDNRPHTAAVWYVWDGATILMFSKPKNQKVVNIRANPNVILALDDTNEGDDPIAFEGTAALVDDVSIDQTQAYLDKYGDQIREFNWTPQSMAADYSQAIRITPTKRLG
jgi:PPOX class probable F420-dependent enzyme